MKNKKLLASISSSLVCLIIFIFALRSQNFSDKKEAKSLNHLQEVQLQTFLDSNYEEKRNTIHKLSYSNINPALDINAKAAILIDVASGDIIYGKNVDLQIPPASMTKLFTMYIVEEDIKNGKLSYSQTVELPPECWACNMPPHSSLMFLGEGQIVTLEELLLGLSVCSGNDAAYAIAYGLYGGMNEFVKKMNETALLLGLKNTHFVENSGYSEENITTAKDMATFCTIYLRNHEDSLQRFHSVPKITYPLEHNMAIGDIYQDQDFTKGLSNHITMGVTQQNTNPLLGKIEGCDGLKTGYIEESGYNLSLTAKRNNTRFLSITMKGPGENTLEGQKYRAIDGTTLMNYAFGSFRDYTNLPQIKNYKIYSYGTKDKIINLVPAVDVKAVCVPFLIGGNMEENLSNIKIEVEYQKKVYGQVECGTPYGNITIKLDKYVLDTIPLVADRSTKKSNFFIRFVDKILFSCKKVQ